MSKHRAAPQQMAKALEKYAEWCGSVHDDWCPCDDTCNCSGKWINDGVTDAVNYLRAAPQEGETPAAEGRETHRCSGCAYRWSGPLKGAELCGDCWRKGQPVVHGWESAQYEAIGRYAVKSARWIRHDHEHYAAVPVAFGANLESRGRKFDALLKAAKAQEGETPGARPEGEQK